MTSRLPLFRILQASLSNVQRHAESPSVDIRFWITAPEAKLEVKDCGKGTRLEVESDATGTLVRTVSPISASVRVKKSGK